MVTMSSNNLSDEFFIMIIFTVATAASLALVDWQTTRFCDLTLYMFITFFSHFKRLCKSVSRVQIFLTRNSSTALQRKKFSNSNFLSNSGTKTNELSWNCIVNDKRNQQKNFPCQLYFFICVLFFFLFILEDDKTLASQFKDCFTFCLYQNQTFTNVEQ